MKVTVTRPRLYPRIGIVHGPGPILKDEASWRTWNGIFFRWTKGRTIWVEVRG